MKKNTITIPLLSLLFSLIILAVTTMSGKEKSLNVSELKQPFEKSPSYHHTANKKDQTADSDYILSMVPASGPEKTKVIIYGRGFYTLITAVTFNNHAIAFTVLSDTEIQVEVPENSVSGVFTVISSGDTFSTSVFNVMSSDCSGSVLGTDLYISELYDHVPGSYGVIELYNPTGNVINFNGQYVLERAGDIGGPASYTLVLTGSVGPESTYLVLSSQGSAPGCNVPINANMGSGINSNDEFKLRKNGTLIDIARAPNYNGYTVIRKPNASAPTSNYNNADWNSTSNFSCANLGNHVVVSVVTQSILTQPVNATVCKNNTAVFNVSVTNAASAVYQWKMSDASGLWVNVPEGAVYSGTNTASLSVLTNDIATGIQFYCEITYPTCTLTSQTVQLTITPLPEVTFDITNPDCDTATGQITITPVSGSGFLYSINDVDFQTDPYFNNLLPGSYTLTVKTIGNCNSNFPFIITPSPDIPPIAEVQITHPGCEDTTGGFIIISPVGSGFTYSLDGITFQDSTEFENVAPGDYTLIVKQGGCTSDKNISIHPVPVQPSAPVVTITQPDCGQSAGSLQINTPVGNEFTYSINGVDYQNAPLFSDLSPGSYSVTVRNEEGCISPITQATINEPPAIPLPPVIEVQQPDCESATASLFISAPQGSGWTYSINGTDYQNSPVFSALLTGTYNVTVKNNQGCVSSEVQIVVNPAPATPAQATVKVTHPTCIQSGSIEVIAPLADGWQYSINGVDYQNQPLFDNLSSGNYYVWVRNIHGCISRSENIIVNVPDSIAEPSVALVQPNCSTATGSINITMPLGSGLEYSIDGLTFQSSPLFTNVNPGTYQVYVRDKNGCSASSTVTLDAITTLTLTGWQGCVEDRQEKNYILEVISMETAVDSATMQWIWKNAEGAVIHEGESRFNVTDYVNKSGIKDSEFPLRFTVTVSNKSGCEQEINFTVESIFCSIPKGISPNNDGYNDNFNLIGLNVSRLVIYNRNGTEVYSKSDYRNEWYGQTHNGNDLPTGTYFYVITPVAGKSQSGWIYLTREIQ